MGIGGLNGAANTHRRAGRRGDDADMTAYRDAYREFTGKTVEEALRGAREEFGVGLDELDFEILTPGSRGVLGMAPSPPASWRLLARRWAAPLQSERRLPRSRWQPRVMIGRSARGATVTLATTAIVDRARPGTTTEDLG